MIINKLALELLNIFNHLQITPALEMAVHQMEKQMAAHTWM